MKNEAAKCLHCNEPIARLPRGRPRLFCSNLCKERDRYDRTFGKSERKPNRYRRAK